MKLGYLSKMVLFVKQMVLKMKLVVLIRENTHSIDDPDKKAQEIASLIRIPDSFRKIVVVKDYMKPWRDEHGIQYIGVEQFLLDEDFLAH